MVGVRTKEILSDPQVRAFLRTNNYIAARDLALRVFIEILFVWTVYWAFESGSWIVGFITFYFLSIWHSFWGYAGIGHELLHGRVFSSKSLNMSLYYAASFLVWSNPVFFRNSHFHHHHETFSDSDTEARGVQNWRSLDIFFYLTLDIASMFRRLCYSLVNSFGFSYMNYRFMRLPRAHQIAATMNLVFQILIQWIIYLYANDLFYNALWLILPFTAQLINRLLAKSQHIGLSEYHELGPLSHSRSIRIPRLLSFLYAGMNYHAEHHLVPSMPYYSLPKFSRHLIERHKHKILDWRSFYSKEFFVLLRRT